MCEVCAESRSFTTWFSGPQMFYACKGSEYDCCDFEFSVVPLFAWLKRNPNDCMLICDGCIDLAIGLQLLMVE